MMHIRTVLFRLLICCAFMLALPVEASSQGDCRWPLWHAYVQKFIQADGRVIDFHGENNETTSEGQAYSLFFALVNNDQETFRKLLNWIQYNLAEGDLSARLPAWHWGKQAGGQWGVLDKNPASDADLWLAYTLFEAGRLWHKPEYQALAGAILSRVKLQEIIYIKKLGPMLLPGPKGFDLGNNRWRFNPSYLPVHLVRYFSHVDPSGPWHDLLQSQLQMLKADGKQGYAADWLIYDSQRGWQVDEVTAGVGSFDAIRVYLWIGLLDAKEPAKAGLSKIYGKMNTALMAQPVRLLERVNVVEQSKPAPVGFYAALLPYATSFLDKPRLQALNDLVKAKINNHLLGDSPNYYDQVLGMFGLGWQENRYRYDAQGQLLPNWQSCKS